MPDRDQDPMREVSEIMTDPAAHYFAKWILLKAEQLDPVDALADLEAACTAWRAYVDRLLNAGSGLSTADLNPGLKADRG